MGGLFITRHGFGGVTVLAGEPHPQPPLLVGDSLILVLPKPLESDTLLWSFQSSRSSGGFTPEPQLPPVLPVFPPHPESEPDCTSGSSNSRFLCTTVDDVPHPDPAFL